MREGKSGEGGERRGVREGRGRGRREREGERSEGGGEREG